MSRFSAAVLVLALSVFAASGAPSLCAALNEKHSPVETVAIRAILHATMHGTYLSDDHCATSLLLVLPEEIPGYRGPVKIVKDAPFERFLAARYDYRPDAPPFKATFRGIVETAKNGSGLATTGTIDNASYCNR